MMTFNNRDWLSACSHLSFSLSHGISWEPQWSGRKGRVKGQEVEQGGRELHVEHHHTEGTTGSTPEATVLVQHVIHCLFVFSVYITFAFHVVIWNALQICLQHTQQCSGSMTLGSFSPWTVAVVQTQPPSVSLWRLLSGLGNKPVSRAVVIGSTHMGAWKQIRMTKGLWDDDRCLLTPIKS